MFINIISNQKEESISIQRVYKGSSANHTSVYSKILISLLCSSTSILSICYQQDSGEFAHLCRSLEPLLL